MVLMMIATRILGKLTLFCLGFVYFPSFGQYTFITANEGFNYLNATATNTTSALVWGLEDSSFHIPLGFSTRIDSVSYDSIKFDPGTSEIQFFQSCRFKDTVNGPVLLTFLTGLVDRGFYYGTSDIPMSPVSYLTEGLSGNRVFKLEWQNAGFTGGDADDYMSFQLWIHEGSNIIEVRFGPNSNPTDVWTYNPDGPMVFFTYNFNCTPVPEAVETIWLYGSKNSPQFAIVDSANSAPSVDYLSGVPQNGTEYRFIPGDVSADNQENMFDIVCYPNPFDEYTLIKIKSNNNYESYLEIYNHLGEVVQIGSVRIPGEIKISREGLPAGIYFYRLLHGNSVLVSGKIIAK